MAPTSDTLAREMTIAELKRLITSGTFETLEKLEEAVDAFLWSEHDQLQAAGHDRLQSSKPGEAPRRFPR